MILTEKKKEKLTGAVPVMGSYPGTSCTEELTEQQQ